MHKFQTDVLVEEVLKVPCLAGGAGFCVKEDGLEVGGGSNVLGFRNSSRPISCSKVFLNSLDTCCHNPSSKENHFSGGIQPWRICLSVLILKLELGLRNSDNGCSHATLIDYLNKNLECRKTQSIRNHR